MKYYVSFFWLILFSFGSQAQDSAVVDFKHLKAEVTITPSKGKVYGDLVYTLDVLQPTDSIFIDAQKMDFQGVFFNNKEVDFHNDGKRLWLISEFLPGSDHKLRLRYSAKPRQALYFIPTGSPEEFHQYQTWTQGQGKYTSHWLPSFDDANEKLEFDLSIIYPKDNTVIANGILTHQKAENDSLLRWEFDMQQPMSSYLVAMAAGDFKKQELKSNSGFPVELYYPTGAEERLEPTYRHTLAMIEFLENKIGIKYPWQNYKQIPVRDFLYSGMENTGTTIFSDIFLVDSTGFNDRNYVTVNAHELAHQWFGNLVTAASGRHHWLQEGFATYYSLLAEKDIFGEDYFYWKMFQSAEELKQQSDLGKGESLLNPKASSLTFYQKGAWALHILNEKIGKEAFDAGVRNYLEKHQFSTVTTEDFIDQMEQSSGEDLDQFVQEWLHQSAFQGTQAFESLKKSDFITNYLEVAALKPLPLSQKKVLLQKALSFPVNDYIGQEAVFQLSLEDASEVNHLYKKAFATGNLYVRQAIAQSLQQIPEELKADYESLLKDDSYLTQEVALYNLWMNFPKDRTRYLKEMEGVEGFIDKNIRTLWLALNLATPGVEAAKKKDFYEELSSYTSPQNRFQVRQNAFGYLFQLNAFDAESLYNLMEAGRHHNYRFREYAKQLLRTLEENGVLGPDQKKHIEQKFESRK